MAGQREVYNIPPLTNLTELINYLNSQLQRIAERLDSIESRLTALE